MSRVTIAGIAAAGGAVRRWSSATLFTVDQTEQVLITQFGQPVRVDRRSPGCMPRLPFVQTVITFDKRLLNLELPGEQVILGDQRRLVVDSFTAVPHHRPAAATTSRSARWRTASAAG